MIGLTTILKEKEVLLQEIFHRTKNNMQIISSILGLKIEGIKNNKETARILEEMKNRIQTIALVHQMLFKSNNLSKINLAEYISDLLSNSLKYAFPGDKIGKIVICLIKNEDGFIEHKISDNGIGMRQSDFRGANSLGLRLFHMLAEQLSAKTVFEIKERVSWDIIFKDNLYSERV